MAKKQQTQPKPQNPQKPQQGDQWSVYEAFGGTLAPPQPEQVPQPEEPQSPTVWDMGPGGPLPKPVQEWWPDRWGGEPQTRERANARLKEQAKAEDRGRRLYDEYGHVPLRRWLVTLETADPERIGRAFAAARGNFLAAVDAGDFKPEDAEKVLKRFREIQNAVQKGAMGTRQAVRDVEIQEARKRQGIGGPRDLSDPEDIYKGRMADATALDRALKVAARPYKAAGYGAMSSAKGLADYLERFSRTGHETWRMDLSPLEEDIYKDEPNPISQFWAETLKEHKHWAPVHVSKGADMLSDPQALFEQIASALPLFATMMTATAVGHPEVGIALIYAVENQAIYDDMYSYAINHGVPEDEARAQAETGSMVGAAAITAIEFLQGRAALRLVGIGKGAVHKAIVSATRRQLRSNTTAVVGQHVRAVLMDVVRQYGEEASQEAVSRLVPAAIQGRDVDVFDLLNAMHQSGEVGAGLGLGAGGAGTVRVANSVIEARRSQAASDAARANLWAASYNREKGYTAPTFRPEGEAETEAAAEQAPAEAPAEPETEGAAPEAEAKAPEVETEGEAAGAEQLPTQREIASGDKIPADQAGAEPEAPPTERPTEPAVKPQEPSEPPAEVEPSKTTETPEKEPEAATEQEGRQRELEPLPDETTEVERERTAARQKVSGKWRQLPKSAKAPSDDVLASIEQMERDVELRQRPDGSVYLHTVDRAKGLYKTDELRSGDAIKWARGAHPNINFHSRQFERFVTEEWQGEEGQRPAAESVGGEGEQGKSTGHLMFYDVSGLPKLEYFRYGDAVYSSPADSPIAPNGYRSGSWEAPASRWGELKKLLAESQERDSAKKGTPKLPPSKKAEGAAKPGQEPPEPPKPPAEGAKAAPEEGKPQAPKKAAKPPVPATKAALKRLATQVLVNYKRYRANVKDAGMMGTAKPKGPTIDKTIEDVEGEVASAETRMEGTYGGLSAESVKKRKKADRRKAKVGKEMLNLLRALREGRFIEGIGGNAESWFASEGHIKPQELRTMREFLRPKAAEPAAKAKPEAPEKQEEAKTTTPEAKPKPQEAEKPAETKPETQKPKKKTPAETLKDHGLVVTPSKSGSHFDVSGNTYKRKELLKDLGGKWIGKKKVWRFLNNDPTEGIANALNATKLERVQGVPEAGPGATERTGDGVEGGGLGGEGVRPGKPPRFEGDVGSYVRADTQRALKEGGKKASIPDEVIDGQIEDTARILKAHKEDKPMFLLGNAAGTGKTFVLGAAIDELKAAGAEQILYVTMNKTLIEQIQKDLGAFNIEGVEFITYDALGSGAVQGNEYDAVVFDESQKVKKPTSKRGKAAQKVIANSKFTIMASATPFENPAEARYLHNTGMFKDFTAEGAGLNGFEGWARHFNVQVKVGQRKGGNQYYKFIWRRGKASELDAMAAQQWFVDQGVYVQRDLQLSTKDVESSVAAVKAGNSHVKMFDEITAAFQKAIGSTQSNALRGGLSMYLVNLQKRILEGAKVDEAIKHAKAAMDDGRYPVIFCETKSARVIDANRVIERWQEQGRKKRKSSDVGRQQYIVAQILKNAGYEYLNLPSVPETIQNALGEENVAIYTGAVTDAQAEENLQAWRRGGKRCFVGTMAKGGTGLSLHDTVGDHPTTQILLNLPWKPTKVTQVLGRTTRYGLKLKGGKKAKVHLLFATNIPFDKGLADRVGQQMLHMGLTLRGDTDKMGRDIAAAGETGKVPTKTEPEPPAEAGTKAETPTEEPEPATEAEPPAPTEPEPPTEGKAEAPTKTKPEPPAPTEAEPPAKTEPKPPAKAEPKVPAKTEPPAKPKADKTRVRTTDEKTRAEKTRAEKTRAEMTATEIAEVDNEPLPGTTVEMSPWDIALRPGQMQYKEGGDVKTGVRGTLKDVNVFNRAFAGVVDVWYDRDTREMVLVDGHQRLGLARRAKEKGINVLVIDAENASEARRMAALINLANGQGSPVEAAVVLRESKDPKDIDHEMEKAGVDLSSALVRQARALSHLHTDIFASIRRGQKGMTPKLGEALGTCLWDPEKIEESHERQVAALRALTKKNKNKLPTGEEVWNLLTAYNVADMDVKRTGQATLFEGKEAKLMLWDEMGTVIGWLKKRLTQEKTLLKAVTKRGAAKILGKRGTKVNLQQAEQGKEMATAQKRWFMEYMSLPPIRTVINKAAERLSEGEKIDTVGPDALKDVRKAIEEIGQQGGLWGGTEVSEPVDSPQDFVGKYQTPSGMLPFNTDEGHRQLLVDFLRAMGHEGNTNVSKKSKYGYRNAANVIANRDKVPGNTLDFDVADWMKFKYIKEGIAPLLVKPPSELIARIQEMEAARLQREQKKQEPASGKEKPARKKAEAAVRKQRAKKPKKAKKPQKEGERPEEIAGTKVITLDTEKRIQALKSRLTNRGEMTEDAFQAILAQLNVRGEPRFVSREKGKWITDKMGHRIIDRMNTKAPPIKEQVAIDKAASQDENAEGSEAMDGLDAIIDSEAERAQEKLAEAKKALTDVEIEDKGLLPLILNRMDYFYDKVALQTGLPLREAFDDVFDAHRKVLWLGRNMAKRLRKMPHFINRFPFGQSISEDRAAKRRIYEYIASKAVETTVEYPEGITKDEIAIAKQIEAELKHLAPYARLMRALDYIRKGKVPAGMDTEKGIEQLEAAMEVYETQGREALWEHIQKQTWGTITQGYFPQQVTRRVDETSDRARFRTIESRVDPAKPLAIDPFEMLMRYQKGILNAVYLQDPILRMRDLVNQAIDEDTSVYGAKDRKDLRDITETFFKEAKHDPVSKGAWAAAHRVTGQAFRSVFLELYLSLRNSIQNIAYNPDTSPLRPFRTLARYWGIKGKITPENMEHFMLMVDQSLGIEKQLMRDMDPLGARLPAQVAAVPALAKTPGLLGAARGAAYVARGHAKWAQRFSPYSAVDKWVNRYPAYGIRLNIVRKAAKDLDLSDAKSVRKFMRKAKMATLDLRQQRKALGLLMTDGVEAAAQYMATAHTYNVHFMYDRPGRSPVEQGPESRFMASLLAYSRSRIEQTLKALHQSIRSNKYQTRLAGIAKLLQWGLVAHLVGLLFTKGMNRDEKWNPYSVLSAFMWEPGGLATGALQALAEVYQTGLRAGTGDSKALAQLPYVITKAGDLFIPGYAISMRMLDTLKDQENVDRYKLREVRAWLEKKIYDSDYTPEAQENTRNLVDSVLYVLFRREAGSKYDKKELYEDYREALTITDIHERRHEITALNKRARELEIPSRTWGRFKKRARRESRR